MLWISLDTRRYANFLCLWKSFPHAEPPHLQEWEAVRGGEGAMRLEETFSTERQL